MMSKAKLVALIISIVIAVAILPLMFISYQKFYLEPTLQRYPKALQPYIDLNPFFATSYALYTYAVWLLLFSLWMVKSIIKTRKTAMVTTLILCINFSFLAPVLVHATSVIHVDILCVMDEEAKAADGESLCDLGLENCIAPRYYDAFSIEFHYHKWYYWDSDDSKTYRADLLYEAISGMDWHWGKSVDGEPMELMIVVTGQDMDGHGLSLPWERALIVEKPLRVDWYVTVALFTLLIFHELGHQFDLLHCGDLGCFMNTDTLLFLFPTINWYCGSCSAKIMANRECLLKPVPTMKTKTDGYFYIPNTSPTLIVIKLLFDDPNVIGDQTGAGYYPDGYVNAKDATLVGVAFGSVEGGANWDYMADIVPDRVINVKDSVAVGKNFGKSGTYITSFAGVEVTFNVGGTRTAVGYGFVEIPSGATSFIVKRNYTPIGAMLRIGKWLS